MCGRYTIVRGEQVIRVIPNITIRADLRLLERSRFNVAPGQDIPVISRGSSGQLEIAFMKWGLIPHWAKEGPMAKGLINARAETLTEKPAFRDALQRRRCLIPADGFYEWKKSTHAKAPAQPMYIRLKEGKPFAFAGLWDTWKNEKGESVQTVAIITTHPNEHVAPIHDRMPAILSPEAAGVWLAEKAEQPPVDLLTPVPAGVMESYPLGRGVNEVKIDNETLIARAEILPELSSAPRPSQKKKPGNNAQPSLFEL